MKVNFAGEPARLPYKPLESAPVLPPIEPVENVSFHVTPVTEQVFDAVTLSQHFFYLSFMSILEQYSHGKHPQHPAGTHSGHP